MLYFHSFLIPVPDECENRRFTPWRLPGQAGERKYLLQPAEVELPNVPAGGLLTAVFLLTVIVTALQFSQSVYVFVQIGVCREEVSLAVKCELPSEGGYGMSTVWDLGLWRRLLSVGT